MNSLNDEEIENLKRTHPKKRILRLLFLFIGSVLILLGFLFLLTGFDFDITLDGINISLLADVLIIVIGMIIASKYFIAPYYLRENSITVKTLRNLREPVNMYIKFTSLSIIRLIAAGLLIQIGLFSLLIFGLDVGHEVRYGSAVVLGGPSFFYVSGLPALGIGLSLLLYFLLSPFRGTFSQSENFYFFYELRPGFPWLTEIPKKDIEGVRYQNNHLGPKLAWVILLMPFIVLQLMTAIPLFEAERAAPEYVLSITFTITSIIEIIVLLILVMLPQNFFEIATEQRLYEMWFSPVRLRNQPEITKDIANVLGCEINERVNHESSNSSLKRESDLFSEVGNTHFHLLTLIFGIFLIISAIIMLTQMVLFGHIVWWISLIYGFMLIIKAVNYDFSKRGGDLFYFNPQTKVFSYKRNFGYKFHYTSAFKTNSVKVKKWFRRLDFFDIIGSLGLLIFLMIQQVGGWILADTPTLMLDNVISTIFMVMVIIFIFLYICLPIDVVEFTTPSLSYRIPITMKHDDSNLILKYLNNLKNFPKDVFTPELKKTFLIRMGILLAIISGVLIYLAINFTFYF